MRGAAGQLGIRAGHVLRQRGGQLFDPANLVPHAAQLGMKVACVEKDPALGGTCLNIGCIPSKALLNSSEKFVELVKHADEHGIKAEKVELDLSKFMQRKEKIVKQLTTGIGFLFKKNKITRLNGTASFVDKRSLKVKSSKELTLSAKNFI
ncbi:MAG: FAD-dependent oxidoreductase, partial [Alphaproteobacteria bacterium]|nr:FAD-dependent oxidoreductase [Alphaproteobacteria bacterium]